MFSFGGAAEEVYFVNAVLQEGLRILKIVAGYSAPADAAPDVELLKSAVGAAAEGKGLRLIQTGADYV